ncbi:MAG: helix-turn-helix transcriptional regulator [Acidimicrobiales bacterium]
MPEPGARDWSGGRGLFELAPPRRFLFPTILLLLAEEPRHGYSLMGELRDLRFGHVDRPSVYRALAQLQRDGLLESWSETPTAGPVRHVYGLTPTGERALRTWMHIVVEERDILERVLRRYRERGNAESLLVQVEDLWMRSTPTSTPFAAAVTPATPAAAETLMSSTTDTSEPGPQPRRNVFRLEPERSAVLIQARSSVGPIEFGALGLVGWIDVELDHGVVVQGSEPRAHIDIDVNQLQSGNALYDAELRRRIDARRFPLATVELREASPVGSGPRYRLSGDVTFHGVRKQLAGAVDMAVRDPSTIVVTGEQMFDVRDFDITLPAVLQLRIYPDVRIHLRIEASLT